MQTSANFTEKPKSREDQVTDEEEARLFNERLREIEDDEDEEALYDEDDFAGMNDYYPNSEAW